MISAHALLRIAGTLLLASTALRAPARADVRAAGEVTDTTSCLRAGLEAEQAWGLPPGMLAAIGRVESGRYDAATGRVLAWPWSINAAGVDHVFSNVEDAIQAVRDLRMRGVRSIDAGCFQINLMYHAGAFGSLEQAFDPRANAGYAAKFLTDLRARSGSWELAVAWYHSATPGVGDRYRDRVMALLAGGDPTLAAGINSLAPRAFAVSATNTRGDAYMVRIVPQTVAMHIWTPAVTPPRATMASATTVPALPSPVRVALPAMQSATIALRGNPGRMPRIITPNRI